jgi:hypothetical protein
VADPIQLAFSALIAEQLEDLDERFDSLPKPEVVDYQWLADMVAARLQPQIDLMNERLTAVATDLALLKMRARRWR